MPNTTPNFGLPYPAPGDDPCEFAEQWCDFTNAVSDVLAGFQAGADRVIPLIPIAMLQLTSTVSVGGGGPIPFDTVVIDTAGMTDIDADPYTITVTRPGRYTVGAMIQMFSIGAPFVPAEISISVLGSGSAPAETIDRGAGPIYWLTGVTPATALAAGETCRLHWFYGGVDPFPIDAAWLAVFWHADSGTTLS